MQDLVIAVSKNVLKLTCIIKNDLKTLSSEISLDIVNDSHVINTSGFSEILTNLIPQVCGPAKKIALNFVAEPDNVLLRFVTIPKKNSLNPEEIINDIKDKNKDINFEDLYFSYEKIAPFVYQFIAVKKDYIQNIIEISDIVGLPIKSITPWVALLPKFVNTSDPAIFIRSESGTDTVALSEMGGIFFCGEYSSADKAHDVQKVVQELSVYKRSKPITSIFTVNGELGDFGSDYKVTGLDFGPKDKALIAGYEANLMTHYIIDNKVDFLNSQINVVNLLPLPTVERKPLALAKVGVGLALTTLTVAVIFGGVFLIAKSKANKIPDNIVAGVVESSQSNVLSSEDVANESSLSQGNQADLKKSDLVVRIENGSGINGIAAKTKVLLETAGYKVIEIDTADELRDSTLLRFKDSRLNFKDLVVGDMKAGFQEPSIENNLDSAKTYDLLVVVGKNVSL